MTKAGADLQAAKQDRGLARAAQQLAKNQERQAAQQEAVAEQDISEWNAAVRRKILFPGAGPP
jgi:hypothetical protein